MAQPVAYADTSFIPTTLDAVTLQWYQTACQIDGLAHIVISLTMLMKKAPVIREGILLNGAGFECTYSYDVEPGEADLSFFSPEDLLEIHKQLGKSYHFKISLSMQAYSRGNELLKSSTIYLRDTL